MENVEPLFVLVLPQEEVVGEWREVRIVVDHLGLAIGVVDVPQRLRGGLLSLSQLRLSLGLLWLIKKSLIKISFIILG